MSASRFLRDLRHKPIFAFALSLLFIVALASCSDDEKNPASPGGGGTPTTTSFTGLITDGVQSGKLTVTVNTTSLARGLRAGQATVAASGNIKIGSSNTSLTGTYDPTLDSLYLDGGGWSLRGEYDVTGSGTSISGACTSPNGPGFFASGNFGANAIKVYTGKYYNQAMTDSGTWNMATYADTVFIVAYNGNSDPILLNGLLSGTAPNRDVTAHAGDAFTFELDATGTLDTDTGLVGGLWTYVAHDPGYGSDDNGDWNGALVP